MQLPTFLFRRGRQLQKAVCPCEIKRTYFISGVKKERWSSYWVRGITISGYNSAVAYLRVNFISIVLNS